MGVAGGQAPCHQGTHGVPDHRGDGDAQCAQQGRQVVGVTVDADRTGERRAAGSGGVDPDHLEPFGQLIGLDLVEVRGAAQAVHHQHRRALPGDLDGQFLVVDLHICPFRR
jgi:hypothetical protein